MKSFATLAAFIALVAQASALTLNTPASIVQCEPVQFSWTSDGTPPYFLTLIPGGQPTAAPLKQFPQTTATEYTWLADLAAGTSVTGALRDSTGNQVFTQALTIQPGTDATCLNTTVIEGTVSSGASAPAGATTIASGATTTPAGSTTGASTSGTKVSTTAKASGTTTTTHSSSSSSSSNAASRGASVGAFGLAGVMGLIGAALL